MIGRNHRQRMEQAVIVLIAYRGNSLERHLFPVTIFSVTILSVAILSDTIISRCNIFRFKKNRDHLLLMASIFIQLYVVRSAVAMPGQSVLSSSASI